MGELLGIAIGTVFVGGLFGWVINKLVRLPYQSADAIGLLILVLISGFTNSSGRAITTTWTIYGVAALAAYFVLQRLRGVSRQGSASTPAYDVAPAPLLANQSIEAPSAAEIELEEEIVSAVRAQYAGHGSTQAGYAPDRPKRQNFIARHWRGEFSLPVSYWLINVVANVMSVAAVTALTLTFQPSEGYEPATILALLVATWLSLLTILVWQIVGLWRSADRRVGQLRFQRASAFWPRLAQVMAVIGVLQFVAGFNSSGAPQLTELSRIVFQNDPDIPDATLQISGDARTLTLDGGIKYGLARQVETLLSAAPSVTGLLLRSPGGRIAEAVKVFDVVRARGLDTFVSDECSSACTLVFVAGRNRLVGRGGRLGFHGSYFPGATSDDLKDANKDWARVYRSAGLSEAFLVRALSVAPEDIWYPDSPELQAAGVTVGSVAQAANVPSMFAPQPTLESIRQELLASATIYEAIDVYLPASASQMYQVALDYSLGLTSVGELRERANQIIADAVHARIAVADDQMLVEFAAIAAAQYAELMVRDPAICFRYAANVQPPNVADYLSKELVARELANNERIIRGGLTPSASNDRDQQQGWANVSLALERTLTTDQFAVFTSPVNEVGSQDYGTYCLASVAFMEEIAKLPSWQVGPVVRSLFQ